MVLILAHIGHWYGALGFFIPALLIAAWVRLNARRDGRPAPLGAVRHGASDAGLVVTERWELARREGAWVLLRAWSEDESAGSSSAEAGTGRTGEKTWA